MSYFSQNNSFFVSMIHQHLKDTVAKLKTRVYHFLESEASTFGKNVRFSPLFLHFLQLRARKSPSLTLVGKTARGPQRNFDSTLSLRDKTSWNMHYSCSRRSPGVDSEATSLENINIYDRSFVEHLEYAKYLFYTQLRESWPAKVQLKSTRRCPR